MREIKDNNFESQTIAAQQNRKERDYWLNQLAGEIVKSRFPYDRPIPLVEETKPEQMAIVFPEPVSSRLNKISGGYDPNLYMILMAGVILLLDKYTGNRDIIVGTPVLKQAVERNFINTLLVIRSQVTGQMTFKEFSLRLKQTIKEAVENQNYPIETLVYKLNLEFNHYDFPLFDAAVLLENIHDKNYLHPIKPNILFSFQRDDRGINGSVEYNALLYEKSTIQRIIIHLKKLVQEVIFNSGIKVAQIETLSPEEKKRLLVDFNDNRADFPADQTVYHFLEKHAALEPGRPAIGYNDELLTYSELNNRTNQLARLINRSGIRGGQLLGILLNRSPLMAISILAAWKVGCAYIPIDTNQPVQRIKGMLKDAHAAALLTRAGHLHQELEGTPDLRLIVLDDDRHQETMRRQDRSNPGWAGDMKELSYIIYTSGSMGTPKGAMVEHIGMMNHIQGKINDLHLTGKSIIGQNASHCFDISVWQFFTSLVLGGKTMIYPDECVLEPVRFLAELIADKVTILEVVPSYLSVLLSILDMQYKPLPSLECLLVTGETIKPDLARQWFEKYPGIKMVNAYGPTEASDDITHYIMEKAPLTHQVAIGRSLQNMNIYIVDEHMKLCPIGVKGEIVVSGIGVGRGYLNDPGKTHQAFMKDPFTHGNGKGARLYKTGDLGCWRPDGIIDFFGRKDYQVKIRGYRIELEEIEKKLVNYQGIREAVVIEKEKNGNEINPGVEKFLCGFITADEKLDPAKIKAYLEEMLPGYMVPGYIEQIEQIPLTPNGKVNRKALAQLEITVEEEELAAASNVIQEKLVQIWAEVLALETGAIGIDSNFFLLGGHSIRATLLAAKINKEFNTNIQLKHIFERPTIKTFSKLLKQSASREQYIPIEPVEKKEYYPLSAAQTRLFFIQQVNPETTAYNLPMVFEYEGMLEKDRFEAAVKKLIARHESFRTSFEIVGELPVQEIHNQVEFEIEYYQEKSMSMDEISRNFVRSFDLSRAPLLRMALIETGREKCVLMIDVPHIIVDYGSQPILFKDFFSFYTGKQLPPLKLQYKDYSEFQNSKKEQERIKKQEEYWLKEFQGEIPRLQFPTDFPRPERLSYKGSKMYLGIDTELTGKIKKLVQETGTTLFMVLLAVYNILLSKYTGKEDIVVGTPGAGRNHADLQNIIGMFINMMALRNFPARDKAFGKFLIEVKEKCVNAYDHENYQYDELVRKLGLQGDLNMNPLFDVTIQVINVEEVLTESDDSKFKPYGFEHKRSLFDLQLEVFEVDDKLSMTLIYSTELFKKSTVEKIAKHYIEILEQVVMDTDTRLKDIKISHGLSNIKSSLTREESMSFEF
jgi:amino acid adenylation domain-containing protein